MCHSNQKEYGGVMKEGWRRWWCCGEIIYPYFDCLASVKVPLHQTQTHTTWKTSSHPHSLLHHHHHHHQLCLHLTFMKLSSRLLCLALPLCPFLIRSTTLSGKEVSVFRPWVSRSSHRPRPSLSMPWHRLQRDTHVHAQTHTHMHTLTHTLSVWISGSLRFSWNLILSQNKDPISV